MESIQPTTAFVKTWRFPAARQARLLAYACRFDKPFWAKFTVKGDTRSTILPDGTHITETLREHGPDGYRYTMTGIPGVYDYQGWFTVEPAGAGQVQLTWKISFDYPGNLEVLKEVATVFANASADMTRDLQKELGH